MPKAPKPTIERAQRQNPLPEKPDPKPIVPDRAHFPPYRTEFITPRGTFNIPVSNPTGDEYIRLLETILASPYKTADRELLIERAAQMAAKLGLGIPTFDVTLRRHGLDPKQRSSREVHLGVLQLLRSPTPLSDAELLQLATSALAFGEHRIASALIQIVKLRRLEQEFRSQARIAAENVSYCLHELSREVQGSMYDLMSQNPIPPDSPPRNKPALIIHDEDASTIAHIEARKAGIFGEAPPPLEVTFGDLLKIDASVPEGVIVSEANGTVAAVEMPVVEPEVKPQTPPKESEQIDVQ